MIRLLDRDHRLLEAWAKVELEGWVEPMTPLMAAAYWGHLGVGRVLLERGAAVTSSAENGWTALHRAAREGHEEVVDLLLRHGSSSLLRLKYLRE